ncbi:MAG: hypothetical protein LBU34_15910 [Planctomycetaceae bacterium]|nr:hypothetical protein [Planctomycetaceae bacterium]
MSTKDRQPFAYLAVKSSQDRQPFAGLAINNSQGRQSLGESPSPKGFHPWLRRHQPIYHPMPCKGNRIQPAATRRVNVPTPQPRPERAILVDS